LLGIAKVITLSEFLDHLLFRGVLERRSSRGGQWSSDGDGEGSAGG